MWFREIARRLHDSRGLGGREFGEGQREGVAGSSRVAATCIFLEHETLRASGGNVCLENVPRLPDRHLCTSVNFGA